MGIAASNAMRDENAADGPAYGSLEALGGPRKFKKKPVLVLDPEELEKAHAMFHEASAELLGEDVERAPRPAMILGLAPMEDDDPEEMGASDDVPDEADDDLPSPDAVLNLTRRKTPALDAGDIYGEDEFGDFGEGYADPDGPAQDDIDLEHRIFPSLPIQPDLQDEEEYFAEELPEAAAEVPAEPEPRPTPPAQPEAVRPVVEEPKPEPKPKPQPSSELPHVADKVAEDNTAPRIEPVAKPAERPTTAAAPRLEDPQAAPLPPLEALHERLRRQFETPPEDEFEVEFEEIETPAPRPATGKATPDFDDADFDLDTWLSEPEETPAATAQSGASSPEAEPVAKREEPALRPAPVAHAEPTPIAQPDPVAREPEPERLPEPVLRQPEPEPDYEPESEPVAYDTAPESEPEAPHEPYDISEEFSDDEAEEDQYFAAEPVAEEHPSEGTVEDDSYTLTDDGDVVDGYAFMRDPRSRRSAVSAAQQGRQSALRAKLLREAELEAAKAELASKRPESPIMRFFGWLRGLFG